MPTTTTPPHSPQAAASPKKLSAATQPFLAALYEILSQEDPAVIGWCDDGESFGVYNVDEMETNVLPVYYRHNKFSSFQRQLNYFGFRKVLKPRAPEPSTFYAQPLFLRDDPSQMLRIKRKTYRFKGGHALRRNGFDAAAGRKRRSSAPETPLPIVDEVNIPLWLDDLPAPTARQSDSRKTSRSRASSESFIALMANADWADLAVPSNDTIMSCLDKLLEGSHIEKPVQAPSQAKSGAPLSDNPFEPIPFAATQDDGWKLQDEDAALLSTMTKPLVSN
ncbi:hypothetical protein LEN26_010399 [Aphanomyces euteiches]|nr:hypothetical protein LEN26_010399 [Aphanomyces euteiches]KAH9196621.1 hypothetical protein AeNC1_001385 [Aphanomyces euteiches]